MPTTNFLNASRYISTNQVIFTFFQSDREKFKRSTLWIRHEQSDKKIGFISLFFIFRANTENVSM